MLQKSASFKAIQGPIVTVVLDGFGITEREVGNAIAAARTPTLDRLFQKYPNTLLKAHGTAVGMPSRRRHGQQRGRPQRDRRGPDLRPGCRAS